MGDKRKFVSSAVLLAFVATEVISSANVVAHDDFGNVHTKASDKDLEKLLGKVNNLAKKNVKIEDHTAVGENEKDGKNKSEKVEDIGLAEGLAISTGSAGATKVIIASTKSLIKHFFNGKKRDVPSLVPTDNPVTDQIVNNEEKNNNEEPDYGIKSFYKNNSLGITIPVTIFAIYFMYVILLTIATVIAIYVQKPNMVKYYPLYFAFKEKSFKPGCSVKNLSCSFLAHLALSCVYVNE